MAFDIRVFRRSELGNSTFLVFDPDSLEGVVIDPTRDIDQYLEVADSAGVDLTWVLETHIHNDFVSGSRELVAARQMRLGASALADYKYPFHALADQDLIKVGSFVIKVMATPGHTPEHVSYLLIDSDGEMKALFSGGALMVGTAARTDLFGAALSWTMAHQLHRSIKDKILVLPDEVIVYPTHGGGSFCAVGAGEESHTTIAKEKHSNPLALAGSSRKFVQRSLSGGEYPKYYSTMRPVNISGAPIIGPELSNVTRLDLNQLDYWIARGAVLLDIRPAEKYRAEHIPGSMAIGADGNLSGWVGWLLERDTQMVLIASQGQEGLTEVREAQRQLLRIGYDRIAGYLNGGITTWKADGRGTSSFEATTASKLAEYLDNDQLLVVVDVRERSEWHAGHIPGSVNIPVHEIPTSKFYLPFHVPLFVHCGHDYRGTLASSLLERDGYRNLTVVADGWDGWKQLEGFE